MRPLSSHEELLHTFFSKRPVEIWGVFDIDIDNDERMFYNIDTNVLYLIEQKCIRRKYMLEELKKKKCRIAVYAILCCLGCLIIAEVPYWIGKMKIIITSDTDSGDILTFLGTYLSAMGTVILGYITSKQTDYANNINNRLLTLEEKNYLEAHKPAISVDYVKLHNELYDDIAKKTEYDGKVYYADIIGAKNTNVPCEWIELSLTNSGKSGIYNCKLKEVTSSPEKLEYSSYNICSAHSSAFNLAPKEHVSINLYVPKDVVKCFASRELEVISLRFYCTNDYNEEYNLKLSIYGEVSVLGAYSYEDTLVPTSHPHYTKIEWDLI